MLPYSCISSYILSLSAPTITNHHVAELEACLLTICLGLSWMYIYTLKYWKHSIFQIFYDSLSRNFVLFLLYSRCWISCMHLGPSLSSEVAMPGSLITVFCVHLTRSKGHWALLSLDYSVFPNVYFYFCIHCSHSLLELNLPVLGVTVAPSFVSLHLVPRP